MTALFYLSLALAHLDYIPGRGWADCAARRHVLIFMIYIGFALLHAAGPTGISS
ncbi:hypothetical protein OLZ32_22100 [Rhizobium sp. 1AS11]|uniref:hypothetical protein n=1 Tax=Rhizobium acaciae TaxID=2989736 RepID=UPI002222204E|nr:hypothetical protein [Rhizobium acaciae]MCW1411073.1 hypothetical protein [Rhizobium acaciae]MCW1743075.1 hypothetical protein [Rhizobium acaciae]